MEFTSGNVLKALVIPATLLLFYFTLLFAWKLLGLPPDDGVMRIVTDFATRYGLVVVFLAGIIEGLLLVGNYFPGGVVIFLGVIAATGNIPRATAVVSVVCFSFFISYTIDYYVGKYGWYKLFVKFGLQQTLDSMQQKLSKHIFSAILSSYWLPNLAAVCSTAAGIMHIPPKIFLVQSAIGIITWNIFWGVLVYITGEALLTLNLRYVLLIFAVWCLLILGKVFILDKYRSVK